MTSARTAVVKTPNSSSQQSNDVCKKKSIEVNDVFARIVPAAAGSFIEWYEFAIYSYVSSYITENFFAYGHGGSMATWAGFAMTFMLRPLGGAYFGWLADNLGRKVALQLTIIIMVVTTVLQGCLPTFRYHGEAWGWFGMVMLLVCRAFQGLSAGGELSTAAVYISEVSPKETLGFHLSWISVSGAFGAWTIAALTIFLIESFLDREQMLSWGWRLPYWTSVVPGLLVIIGRFYLKETPDFEELVNSQIEQQESLRVEQGEKKVADVPAPAGPMTELLNEHKLPMAVGALGIAGIGGLWYVPPVYGIQFIAKYNHIEGASITFAGMLSYFIPTVLAMAVGRLVDRVGVEKVHVAALILGGVLSPGPLFYWWTHASQSQAIPSIFIGQALVGLFIALTTAVYLWVVELFPVRVRTTGVSVAYNLGIGIFGGLGPLLSDFGNGIIEPRGYLSAPAAFTIFCSLLSLTAIATGRILAKRGLMKLTHIRDSPY